MITVHYFTEEGRIHKVVQWQLGEIQSNTVVIWTPFSVTSPIWQMKLITSSSASLDDQLYLASDDAVVQMSVAQCDVYSTCTECLHDPHCGWHEWDKELVHVQTFLATA